MDGYHAQLMVQGSRLSAAHWGPACGPAWTQRRASTVRNRLARLLQMTGFRDQLHRNDRWGSLKDGRCRQDHRQLRQALPWSHAWEYVPWFPWGRRGSSAVPRSRVPGFRTSLLQQPHVAGPWDVLPCVTFQDCSESDRPLASLDHALYALMLRFHPKGPAPCDQARNHGPGLCRRAFLEGFEPLLVTNQSPSALQYCCLDARCLDPSQGNGALAVFVPLVVCPRPIDLPCLFPLRNNPHEACEWETR